jgi:hypothetical protein
MSTELMPSTIPKPPDSADVNEMHKWMLDMYVWAVEAFTKGLQAPFFSQSQIDGMTELSQAGRIFFNNDTGKFMGGEVDSSALTIKTFTTA